MEQVQLYFLFYIVKHNYKTNPKYLNIFFRCTIEKILISNIIPPKGNLKGHTNQVFEITITSYHQPAILTTMFNISYTFVSQIENYKQSLNNYYINKDKLDGIFIINQCGNYKPVIIPNYH